MIHNQYKNHLIKRITRIMELTDKDIKAVIINIEYVQRFKRKYEYDESQNGTYLKNKNNF